MLQVCLQEQLLSGPTGNARIVTVRLVELFAYTFRELTTVALSARDQALERRNELLPLTVG